MLHNENKLVKVARQRRNDSDGCVVYTISWEPTILDDPSVVDHTQIDAYILVFDTSVREQFYSIYSRQIDRVLKMCNTNPHGPKRAIMLTGHHSDPFSSHTAYETDDLRTLMKHSHASFRRANITSPVQCAEVVDIMVEFLVSIHSSHQLSTPRSSPRSPRSPVAAISSVLQNISNSLQLFCTVPSIDDPDKPRDWTDEERDIHCPSTVTGMTPMGMSVANYQ